MNATAIRRHGGKAYLAEWIISHFPPRDSYITYAEPYFGGGSVLFAHDPDGKAEVVNDVDGQLTGFWRALQSETDFARLIRLLEAVPFSQVEFDDAATELDTDLVVRAARFFIRNRQSRQGLEKDFATPSLTRTRRGMNESVSAWLTAVEGLPDFHGRLKRVEIYGEDAPQFISRFDAAGTLFYCDPPYLHETRTVKSAYKYEMTTDQHERMLALLATIKGRFVLSGYPSKMYDGFAKGAGWRRVEREIDNKSGSGATKQKRTECLWMNYAVEQPKGTQ